MYDASPFYRDGHLVVTLSNSASNNRDCTGLMLKPHSRRHNRKDYEPGGWLTQRSWEKVGYERMGKTHTDDV